jgi:asparagine synthase (glutamine-hydrolysing)
MCGIVAVVAAGGGLREPDLDRGIAALRHRGPDGTGSWVSPCGRAALGHTRLAIIDLDTGDQPMHTRDGRHHLVVNGEFYDYRPVREELRRRGHELRTASDSEIALHLYAERGPRAVQRLRGEFAFAVWDRARAELFAARDRFGVKPLYYAEHAGRVYLASEVKALLAMGVPARWDTGSLADHLLVCHAADRTLFAGIRQVPPGCFLRTDGRHVQIHTYWDLDYPTADELAPEPDRTTHHKGVESAVVDAVRTRMHADVPVAYHLSAGLDSGTVVGTAARFAATPTFTVRFDDPALDEGDAARRAAAHLGASNTEIFFRRADFVDGIEATIARADMIQENSHGIARMRQSERIRSHGYKVVLAGEGGDEMFAGYPQSRSDLALSVSAEERARHRDGYAKLATHGGPAHLRGLLDRLGFIPAWILDRYLTVGSPMAGLLSAAFARVVAARDPCGSLLAGERGAAQLTGRTPYHQSMYLFCKTWLCNYLLAAERLDMAHALEVRLPFLDHQLHEVVKWTPPAWHLEGARPKPVLREAMRAYLPPGRYEAAKRPFFAPPAVTDDRVLSQLAEILARPALDELPFLDPVKVRALVGRLRELPPDRRVGYERVVQIVTGIVLLTERYAMRSEML